MTARPDAAGPPTGRVLPPVRTVANQGAAVAKVASRPSSVAEGTQGRTAAPVAERPAVTPRQLPEDHRQLPAENPGGATDVARAAARTSETQAGRVLESGQPEIPTTSERISLDQLESLLRKAERGLKVATLADHTDEGGADWDPATLGSGAPVVLQRDGGASLAARMLGGSK